MSGHSKWHNIQAKKGKADAARGKIFTKLGRELLIAVKEGGPDPAGNSKLKNVIAKCKAANMPNDTINNAIKKASTSNENYEEIIYEGYGPHGVAVIVEASTDNKKPYISLYIWRGFVVDYTLWKLEMIYRTEAEAIANMAEDYEKLTGKKLVGD